MNTEESRIHWISVKDALPTPCQYNDAHSGSVLVRQDSCWPEHSIKIATLWFNRDLDPAYQNNWYTPGTVTHWAYISTPFWTDPRAEEVARNHDRSERDE